MRQKHLVRYGVFVAIMMCSLGVAAQVRYFTKTGTVHFFSKAPLEDIDADNRTTTAVLDTKTGLVQLAVQMKGFVFKKALMQQHFNENYVESDKYPRAEFRGAVVNNDTDWKKTGTYNVLVKGMLTLHGKTKEVQAPATIVVRDGALDCTASFKILLSDFSIAIPALVKDKVSNTIAINVAVHLEPLKN